MVVAGLGAGDYLLPRNETDTETAESCDFAWRIVLVVRRGFHSQRYDPLDESVGWVCECFGAEWDLRHRLAGCRVDTRSSDCRALPMARVGAVSDNRSSFAEHRNVLLHVVLADHESANCVAPI